MKWLAGGIIFLAELAMYYAFVWFGVYVVGGVLGWVLGVTLLAAAVAAWSVFLSPKAPRKLTPGPRFAVRTVMLLLGAAALFVVGAVPLAIAQLLAVLVGNVLSAFWPTDDDGPRDPRPPGSLTYDAVG